LNNFCVHRKTSVYLFCVQYFLARLLHAARTPRRGMLKPREVQKAVNKQVRNVFSKREPKPP